MCSVANGLPKSLSDPRVRSLESVGQPDRAPGTPGGGGGCTCSYGCGQLCVRSVGGSPKTCCVVAWDATSVSMYPIPDQDGTVRMIRVSK
jgi:hypothetical protein